MTGIATPPPHELQTERLLVQRVLSSNPFARAPRLHRFLKYITDRMIENRLDEISEFQIGVNVFDKPSTYNPGDDNVVRSYARVLRKKLEEYFDGEGKDEPMILSVPRGGYVPVFTQRSTASKQGVPESVEQLAPRFVQPLGSLMENFRRRPARPNLWLWIMLVGTSALLGACAGYMAHPHERTSPAVESPFWKLFAGERDTLVVPSDTGLTILLGLTREDVHLADYVTGAYIAGPQVRAAVPEGWANSSVHRYCDLVDVTIIAALARLPEFSMERAHVRFARDVRPDDLKTGNVILIGGLNGNPWGQIFRATQVYTLDFDPGQRSFKVTDRSAKPAPESMLEYGPQNWGKVSYGLIVLRRNLAHNGYVLMLQGVAAAGTQAAAEWISDPANAARISRDALDSRGQLVPFEVLLRTDNVGANAMKTTVLGLTRDEN